MNSLVAGTWGRPGAQCALSATQCASRPPLPKPSSPLANTTYRHTASRIWANLETADWTQDEAEVPGNTTHLWEESWDDDDTSEDFSAQLKYASFSLHFISETFGSFRIFDTVHFRWLPSG